MECSLQREERSIEKILVNVVIPEKNGVAGVYLLMQNTPPVNYVSVPITIQYGSNKAVFVCDFGGLGLSNV
jgi:hypothetical protein